MKHQIFITAVQVPAFENAIIDSWNEGGWTGKRPEVNKGSTHSYGNMYHIECNVQDLADLMTRTGIAYAESLVS